MAKDIGNSLQVSVGSSLPTYKAVLFDVVPYATASDILNISIPTTSTIALVISRVYVSYAATAASTADVYIVRRSTANTGGTPTTLTTTQSAFLSGFANITQHDTNDQASQATVVGYTVAPSPLGTPNVIDAGHITIPAVATPTVSVTYFELNYNNRGAKPPVIRPGQSISLSFGGTNAVPAGASVYATIEWVEVPLMSLF